MPERFEDLLALPGVGRYTAGAICSMAFNQPAPVLDGNVTRVLSRLFCLRGHPGRPARRARLWRLAGQLVGQAAALQAGSRASGTLPAPPNCSHLNQALMELGAVICTPRRPKCPVCPVRDRCRARAAGLAEKLPSPRPVARPTLRRVAAFVVRRRGRYLVRQRDARGVNARLWEFPTVEREGEGPPSRALAGACLGAPAGSLRPLLELRHSITRHRIVLEVFEAGLASGARPSRAAGRWRTPAQLRRLPFTAAHRKILARLERRPS
jgi:A/G-specific adenine glycosylase